MMKTEGTETEEATTTNHACYLDPKYFNQQQKDFDRRRVTAFDAKLRNIKKAME